MTNADLKTRFLIGYEFLANNLAPGYSNDEISGLLNQAMDLLVDELYAKNDIVNLAELLTKSSLTIVTSTFEDYGTKAYQPTTTITEFRWFVNAKLKLTRTAPIVITTAESVPCELIDKRDANYWAQTSFNQPIIIYPKITVVNTTGINTFIILIDNYTTPTLANGFQMIYVKTPTRIDVTLTTVSPELHPRLHQKIVDKAVALAMKATDPKRAQGEIQLNQAI